MEQGDYRPEYPQRERHQRLRLCAGRKNQRDLRTFSSSPPRWQRKRPVIYLNDHWRSRLKRQTPAFVQSFYRTFTVDRCVLRCYKPQKDKLFGGESPNELHKAVASEAADLPGRAGLLSRREYCHATPTTPGGENEPVFTSFLFFARRTLPLPLSLASLVPLRNASARLR